MPELFPYVEHGDIEAACVDILRAHPSISGFPGGVTVSTDLVGWTHDQNWILVTTEGSTQWGALQKLKKPRIDMDCYAEIRETALKLAQLAEAILLQVRGGNYSGHGLTIHHVVEEMGPVRVPEKESEVMRYYLALRFHVIPYEEESS